MGSGLRARQVLAGDGSACVLAVGKLLVAAEEAAVALAADGIDVSVWDVRVVSEPDPAMLADAFRHDVVITAEDGIRQGGAGTYLAEVLRRGCPLGAAPPVVSLGIPRSFIAQDKPDRILSRLGLDGPGLARSVREAVAEVAEVAARSGSLGTRHSGSQQVPDPAEDPPSIPVIASAPDTLD